MKLLNINKKLTVLCALAIAFALPSTSQARHGDHHNHHETNRGVQTITLDRQDLRQLNQNGKIGLKKAIKNKLGSSAINQNTKLVSVEVMGRATGRMSLVTLKIAGSVVDEKRLRRPHCDRHNDRRRGDRRHGERCGNRRGNSVTLYNDSVRNSQGAWKLLSDVDARVRQVTITIKKRRHHQRENKVSLGTAKITKVIGRTKVFHANNQRLTSVTIKAKSNSLDIIDVVVNYRDGSYDVLRRLSGYLGENRSETVQLRSSKAVSSITVDAVSDDLIGSSGRLEVVVGVLGPEPRPRRRNR